MQIILNFLPINIHVRVELLQEEAVQPPLALRLLLLQQRAFIAGSPAHSGGSNKDKSPQVCPPMKVRCNIKDIRSPKNQKSKKKNKSHFYYFRA